MAVDTCLPSYKLHMLLLPNRSLTSFLRGSDVNAEVSQPSAIWCAATHALGGVDSGVRQPDTADHA